MAKLSLNSDVITDDGHIYPEFTYNMTGLKRLGIGRATLSRWRRQGLRVRYLGGKVYVKGSDLADFIDSCGKDEKDA